MSITIKNLGTSCPSQWLGTILYNDCEDELYIRYRWGTLTVYITNELVYSMDIGDGYDGYLSDDKMYNYLNSFKCKKNILNYYENFSFK